MKFRQDIRGGAAALLLFGLLAPFARGQVVISEFMADNSFTLVDEDGDNPDWLELWNQATNSADISGWYLTDSDHNLRKWKLPSLALASGARRVVFCSNKDRRNPGANLHTNFKIGKDAGGYLALVMADGGTIAFAYTNYPAQGTDVAYGLPGDPGWTTLVTKDAAWTAWPSNPTPSATWRSSVTYDDSNWRDVSLGVGYDTNGYYNSLFGFGGDFLGIMRGVTPTLYARSRFSVVDISPVTQLRMRLKYDDGIVTWLNGRFIYSNNVPDNAGATSNALAVRPDDMNTSWETVIVTNSPASILSNGFNNVFGVEVHNVSSSDSDVFLLAELDGYVTSSVTNAAPSYLLSPTPSLANSLGTTNIGPSLNFASNSPARPTGTPAGPPLTIYADASQTLRPVSTVTLFYRVMYSNEASRTMGLSNGQYVAQIPTTNIGPGQMVRWRIVATDSAGVSSTSPPYRDPINNDQYFGTVAVDPSLTNSRLQTLHWFAQTPSGADTAAGTKCSYYYQDRFYDNVQSDLHGQSSAAFPKKSHDLNFNSGNSFFISDDVGRVSALNLIQNYSDKTKTHQQLTYEICRAVGAGNHYDLLIRVQQNAAFYGLYELMDNAGADYLDRQGRDPDGALYKIYDNLSSTSTAEKKTREWEDKSDLQQLINNLSYSVAMDTRRRYVYDNADIPGSISYFVALNLVSSQDHMHKNYYMYRDTPNTGEWTILPWDVDLTWGRNWLQTAPPNGQSYLNDVLFPTNSLDFVTPQQSKSTNRFYSIFYDPTDLRRMYLRRLRTCMDQWVQPPDTPTNALRLEFRFDQMADLIDPPGLGTNTDASLEFAKWGNWGSFSTNTVHPRVEIARTKSAYLAYRRSFLYSTNATTRNETIPDSQPPHMPLFFADCDVCPASGRQEQEYFSLVNSNSIYVDISGWSVTGAVRWTFKPGTVIPSGGGTNQNIGKLYVAKNSRGFRSRTTGPGSNQYCFVQGGYDGQLSSRGESLFLVDDTGYQISSLSWTSNPTLAQQFLRVTEIMYHPAAPSPAESNAIPYVLDQDFEYVEVMNISSNSSLSLSNVQFTAGLFCTFPTNFALAATGRAVVVSSTNAFRLRYGTNAIIACVYTGFLNNAGDRIQLMDAAGENVQDFNYNNAWYPVTDGLGFSLVIRNENAAWDSWDQKAGWRPSGTPGGNAGAPDPGDPGIPTVLINECLTHTDLPQLDTIELYNPNSYFVNLGGWWLSDDLAVPKKYRIPTNTLVGGYGYATFDESQFNYPTSAPTAFRISSVGDDVWLFSGDAAGNLTGYAASQNFGAAQNGVSFGRFVNRAGDEFFVQQATNTLGWTNGYPRVWPAVISEIMYHPPDAATIIGTNSNHRDEFIEIANVSSSNTPLYDVNFPTNTFRLRNAVDFDFPTNIVLPAGGRLLVVGFDPADATNLAAFRAAYSNAIPTNAPIVGPWSGHLDNAGDQIEFKRPDPPNTNMVPYIIIEQISYKPAAPWPAQADGTGLSLQRIALSEFGDDPYNWYPAAPTPGAPANLALDSDLDGAPDWAEYRAGTDATNSQSLLRLLGVGSPATNGILRWQSVPGHTYTIEHATNLLAPPAFTELQSGVPAAGSQTTWTPPATTNTGPHFYRIRIEP